MPELTASKPDYFGPAAIARPADVRAGREDGVSSGCFNRAGLDSDMGRLKNKTV